MVAETRLFGTVDIAEDKILEFPMGLIGFENLKKFAIIYDSDRGCVRRSAGCSPWRSLHWHFRSSIHLN